ncbi:carboxylesterase/lipase family protein [Glacieibacterium megasporae]|uniref:carboxylesterase/lipase family protein n=1 Tax=Glacieibacterium megasporae TaxID=2835787 RepID=UPI001C1E3638|nr:carboxylesterase family protein [Polymorphobacter megasporae]UAJ09100.1 carboxylesterase family protein [Polymorphobacter megasporae]
MSALALAFPAIADAETSDTALATTNSGDVRGAVADGVASWKGIPFAAPPIGALRWRAPQSVKAWRGVHDATAYAHDCMQLPFPSDAAPLGTRPAEDCLYANVWRPAAATGKLPVMVWIYGGGFVNGGASPPTYSGANIARQGVLFMSFNYRVGRFGTFALPQLTKADPDHGRLANYGTMDQIAALEWVRRNIAAFGGDPANVTIVGESAGGMSIHALMTSPLAIGLFQKAVVMSGGNGRSDPAKTLGSAEQIGIDFAKSQNIDPTAGNALDALRALTAEQVTDGLSMMQLFRPQPGPPTFSGPVIDGTVITDNGAAYAAGRFAKIPMVIGATSADMGGKDGFMIAGARDAAAILADQGVPVWEYRFSYVAESVGQPGAQHATDIPFFFDTTAIKYGDKTTPKDVAMGRTISSYLVNFAKTGNPNGAGLLKWPRYARASNDLMDFTADGTAKAERDPWSTQAAPHRK